MKFSNISYQILKYFFPIMKYSSRIMKYFYFIFLPRDKDSLKFVKCVNSRLQGHFHDLALTYYE